MARDFSGTGEYLLTTSTPVTAAPLTMACWFRPDVDGVPDTIFSIGPSGNTTNIIRLISRTDQAGDDLVFEVQSSGTFAGGEEAGINIGAWNSAVGVWVNANVITVYLNGVQGSIGNPASNPAGLNRVGIGVNANANLGIQFDGKIAEPAIWNVALSSGEVAAFHAGVSPALIRPGALVFHKPLVRDIGGGKGPPLTATGTSVFEHPRVLMPRRRGIVTVPVAGGGGGAANPWYAYAQM